MDELRSRMRRPDRAPGFTHRPTPAPIRRPVSQSKPPSIVEPVALTASPRESTKRRNREITLKLPGWKFILLALGAICLVAILVFIFFTHRHHDPLPEKIKQEADFTLYYPTKVPSGFRFDEVEYDSSTKVVTYDYSTIDGDKIFFSLQAKPKNFNFNDFNNKQITGASRVSTPLGTATVGVLQQQTVSSIVTDQTWVLIGAGQNVNIQQLEQVTQSLAPAGR